MSYARPRPDGTVCISIEDKTALGLPTTRCSCRSKQNWVVLFSYVEPFLNARMRRFLCSRCDEEIEVVVRYLYGRTTPALKPPKVQWTMEMKLHLMETPRPVDWGDDELPREIAPPEGHKDQIVLGAFDSPSPLHPQWKSAL